MKKHLIGVHVEKNAFVDSGDGLITFPRGQVIIDGQKLRSGDLYDIPSLDLSEYKGQITADHVDMIQSVIGEALGVAKTENAVTISGIRYAVKLNALARLAYDLQVAGFPLDLSVETYGPWPDDSDDTYWNHKVIGLSVVVTGNSKAATMGKAQMALVHNSLAQAEQDGLDTTEAKRVLKVEEAPQEPELAPKPSEEAKQSTKQEQNKMSKTIKNSRDFAIELSYKNAAGDEVKTELAPGATVDVSEDQAEGAEKQVNEAKAPEVDIAAVVNAAVTAAVKPLNDKIDAIEKNSFDKGAKEPEFKKDANAAVKSGVTDFEKEYSAMDYRDRHGMQIKNAWDWLKGGDPEAGVALRKMNQIHLNKLKADGIVRNSVDLGDFGNFVISRELLTEIQGIRTNYAPLVDATEWKETLSTQMAWLERSGDIDMQPVSFLDDSSNLKPISKYTANLKTADLEELAAVTPVMNSATRFMAADLLSDVAKGYRNDYDRKRAQLVIARLEQAIEANGNSVSYDFSSGAGGNVAGVIDFLKVWTKIGEKTPNGTYVIGTSTFAELQTRALSAGTNGPLANIFTNGREGVPNIFGRPYIVVSDDLLPRLGTNETKSFVVNGVTVTVNSSVFYADLSNFTGRTSGGLSYDLSMEAAYEESGTVKSSFQRNEMILRGSFFRGGAIKDSAQVAALASPGVS